MDAREWNERYGATDLLWGVEPNRFVRDQCQSLPVGVAVDLGCGEGRNALWLARLGWSVSGYDISDVAIGRGNTLAAQEPMLVQERLKLKVADITQEPLRPASVDLSLISYLHIEPEQCASLQTRAAEAVRAGGHLVIVGHDRRNLVDGVGGPQDERLLYDPGQIADRLVSAGMVVEVAATVGRDKDGAIALDTLVRGRRPID